MPKEILCGFGVDVDADCLHVESMGRSPLPRSDPVPRKMFDRTEGGDFARFAEHLVDFACVKLLGIDHPFISALVFEPSKVETRAVFAHLIHVDEGMAERVAAGMRLAGAVEPAPTKVPARGEIKPSHALSIIGKAPQTLQGRVIGLLVSDGADCALIEALRVAVRKEGAQLKIVAPHVGGATTADGKLLEADLQLAGAPSIFFDAVAVIVSEAGGQKLVREAAAVDFVSDAFNHLKVICHVPTAKPLLRRAGIADELLDAGVVSLTSVDAVAGFIAAAKKTRVWDGEPKVRNLP